jgi:preprotein translocase subunit SecE
VARDRQRAKQRQAERRDARLAARRDAPGQPPAEDPADIGAPPETTGRSDTVLESPPPAPIAETEPDDDDFDDPELEADAMEAGALADEGEIFEDELEGIDDGDSGDGGPRGPRGIRGGGGGGRGDAVPGGRGEARGPRALGGSKVLNFLKACWAELQRVQWPDRRTLTQLTGIVLFFVIIAGVYLGVLDQIFSKLVQAIL